VVQALARRLGIEQHAYDPACDDIAAALVAAKRDISELIERQMYPDRRDRHA